jgi:hypothetical protein
MRKGPAAGMAALAAGNVLTLPAAALSQRGNHTLVYTGRNPETGELTDPVEIEIGISDGQIVQVVSGLNEGDTVWYSYFEPSPFASFAAPAAESADVTALQVT